MGTDIIVLYGGSSSGKTLIAVPGMAVSQAEMVHRGTVHDVEVDTTATPALACAQVVGDRVAPRAHGPLACAHRRALRPDLGLGTRRGQAEGDVNLHVRLVLIRDWLRANPAAVPAYAAFKRSLATISPGTGTYAEVKDPVVDLVVSVAEPWAAAVGWHL
jgi:GrpB-like predicted nucleotidyltransferase (UPF0157 family)